MSGAASGVPGGSGGTTCGAATGGALPGSCAGGVLELRSEVEQPAMASRSKQRRTLVLTEASYRGDLVPSLRSLMTTWPLASIASL